MDINKSLVLAHQLLVSGKIDEAESKLNEIIKLDSKNIFALNNLGNLNLGRRNFDKALLFFNKCLKFKPDFYQALINKGTCLQYLDKNLEALDCYEAALKLNPDFVDTYYNLANCFLKLKKYENAIKNYNKVIKNNPNYFKAFYNKGICLEELENYKEALENYNIVIKTKYDFSQAHLHKGNCLQKLKLYEDALLCYKEAIKIKSDYSVAYNNLGCLQLLMGNYDEGWKNYEWRKKEFLKLDADKKWDGIKNLKNKTIYIYKEQGIGDYIQFSRYLPIIKKLGANLILDTTKKLVPLINSMKFDYIHKDMENINDKEFDYHCSIVSLPLLFKTSIDSIPNKTPYFSIDKEKINLWRKKINPNKKNIGIKWTGNKNFWNDKNRSTNLDQIKSLFNLPFEFHSLEIEYSDNDKGFKKKIKNLYCYNEELIGFENTAALIENLDLVITTDTAIAHLCGALNKSSYIMLSNLPDFRWLLNRTDSPWYPSLKLYRQDQTKNWESVIENIKKDLK